MRDRLEGVLAGMDLVSREEFDAVKAMVVKAREEQEALLARIAVLEAKIEALSADNPGGEASG